MESEPPMETETEQTSTVLSKQSWMPLAKEKIVPLAALSVCHVNIDTGCDFHVAQKMREYLNDWQNAAPAHCQSKQTKPVAPMLHANRLGVEIPCESFR